MSKFHSFHIPVLGIGFSVDTPIKVAHLGVDSVVSLSDDILLEKLRRMYCTKFKFDYTEITNKMSDYRAKRITSYLNLMNSIIDQKIQELRKNAFNSYEEITDYLAALPSSSSIKQKFQEILKAKINLSDAKLWIQDNLLKGNIDVNIMTKVDRENFDGDTPLPIEFNDAHAALRGFAQSKLKSSVVFSAGMNPRLYSYITQFEDFYPDINGSINKKIILKVSDYKSALIQGMFLAKKGIWVSEYRIESGLNCGGHAFATKGYLIGPILEEFKTKRNDLVQTVFSLLTNALKQVNRIVPSSVLSVKISAQGGVGTSKEHELLLNYYNVDSVGWGTPFLLVPEATNVDSATLNKLIESTEKDLYLSNISPLGVPFNNLRGNTKDIEKERFIDKGRPGSACPKKFLALNKEYGDKGLCTASRQYQNLKIKELELDNLSPEEHKIKLNTIVEKTCLCVGLGTSALLENKLDTRTEGKAVSICPGPNLAYFSKEMTLSEITNHIYGKINVITRTDRPNMFMKELSLYYQHLKKSIENIEVSGQKKQLKLFSKNLNDGIIYYYDMFKQNKRVFEHELSKILDELTSYKNEVEILTTKIEESKV
ncbi:MAG: hypothetical protein COA58_13205 [Bacteroidetes bacterium]|nr:MAG: hypothetical protein COA58_13205 [Bacteroidota bacterium]